MVFQAAVMADKKSKEGNLLVFFFLIQLFIVEIVVS